MHVVSKLPRLFSFLMRKQVFRYSNRVRALATPRTSVKVTSTLRGSYSVALE